MPLHDVGYRAWEGAKSSPLLRWLAITITGIQIAFRSSWLARTLIVSWVPAIAMGIGFFIYEQSIVRPEMRQVGANMLAVAGASQQVIQLAVSDPEEARHEVWSAILMAFFRYPQAVLMVVVVGIVSPRLIAFDLRSKGFLLYFSRPITIAEYIIGKLLVLWFFLAIITTLPALILYILGLGLASEPSVVLSTWDLPIRIIVASLVLMLPTASVALACSAFTVESRYAAFAWFALWVIGWVVFSVLSGGEFAEQMRASRGQEEFQTVFDFHSRWEVLSPYHTLGRGQQWVFGLLPPERSVLPVASVLTLVTVGSLGFVYRRIHKSMSA